MKELKPVPTIGFAYSKESAEACRSLLNGSARKAHIETYGCQMNVRDSEILYGLLALCGVERAESRDDANVILFNTCCVREHAEKRVFGNVGSLKERKDADPDLIIGVCGCMMQQNDVGSKMMKRFPFLDFVLGTHMVRHLPEILLAVLNGDRIIAVSDEENDVVEGLPSIRGDSVSAFVNINYGCNNYCTYCIVPYVRGPERSRKPDEIIREIESLVRSGTSEITLLGQNVNSYGKDLGGADFPSLLENSAAVDGLKRLRFMTSHPKDLSDRLIETVAGNEKICHHVHLPLQSGSDRILKRMNRHYDAAAYLEIVRKLRASAPDMELTTDIIVGFPGETEEDFLKTLEIVERVGYASAFTFKYSRRKGTPAARMPDQIDEEVKAERLGRLNELQKRKTLENNRKYVGRTGEVLTEGIDQKSGLRYGKYKNFKMVYFDHPDGRAGDYVTVKAVDVKGNSLLGERIAED